MPPFSPETQDLIDRCLDLIERSRKTMQEHQAIEEGVRRMKGRRRSLWDQAEPANDPERPPAE